MTSPAYADEREKQVMQEFWPKFLAVTRYYGVEHTRWMFENGMDDIWKKTEEYIGKQT